jgi:transposase
MPVIGIDVSKAKLHVVVLLDPEGRKVRTKTVANQASGFSALLKFACHQAACAPPDLHVVMEATGVYHETAATYLFDQGATVSVVNPARVKDFSQSLAIQSKTDAQDAAVLARYGLLVKPAAWAPAPQEYRELKALLARLQAIEAQIRREQNRLEKAEASPVPPAVRDSLTQSLAFLKASRDRLTRSINDHIDRHPQLKRDKALLQSIPAVGEKTARVMLTLLYHGDRFRRAREAAAYVGLNPVEHRSGTSVFRQPRLSKRGDGRLRAGLYMAAVVAIRYNPDVRALYQRLLAKGKAKMAALGAAMRKLVHIMFGVLKHQMPYRPQVALAS